LLATFEFICITADSATAIDPSTAQAADRGRITQHQSLNQWLGRIGSAARLLADAPHDASASK
jgi:hypothetical protein